MISCTDHVETFIHSGHLRRACIWVRTAHVSNTLCAVILTSNVERARARTCRCCHVFCLERETHQYLILITVSFSFLCQLSITFFGLCAFYENDDDNHFFSFSFALIVGWAKLKHCGRHIRNDWFCRFIICITLYPTYTHNSGLWMGRVSVRST